MSLAKLLEATKTYLLSRSNFPLTGDELEVLPSPKPPPAIGNRFLSIYGTDWSPAPTNDAHRGLCEQYGIGVTLTYRVAAFNYVGTGRVAYSSVAGTMEPVLRFIIASIHQNIDLIRLANDGAASPIITYLRWRSADSRPLMKGPEWFWSDPSQAGPTTRDVGFTLEATFDGAESYRTYDDILT